MQSTCLPSLQALAFTYGIYCIYIYILVHMYLYISYIYIYIYLFIFETICWTPQVLFFPLPPILPTLLGHTTCHGHILGKVIDEEANFADAMYWVHKLQDGQGQTGRLGPT